MDDIDHLPAVVPRKADRRNPEIRVAEPALAVEGSLGLMLDGYGWQPLSSQWDYKRTRERAHAEAFPRDVVEEILNN